MADLSFNVSPTPGYSDESLTFTPVNDNNAVSWRWDFESNGIIDANARVVSHSYSPDNNDDTFYLVTLQAPGASPETATGLVGIRNRLDYDISISPNPILGHPLVETGIFGVTNQNRDLDPSSFQWDIYKGGSSYTSISGVTGFALNFTENGTLDVDDQYSVQLTVDDKGVTGIAGSEQQKTESINFFVYTFEPFVIPNVTKVGSEISFQVIGENLDSHTYRWEFGDGTYAYGGSTSHIYESAGIFYAKLVVDPGTSNENILSYNSNVESLSSLKVKVSDVQASFSSSVVSDYPPFTASFSDTSSSVFGLTGWDWHLTGPGGDTQVSGETNPSYHYDTAGNYYPVLKVTDIEGQEDYVTGSLTVIQSGIDIKTYKSGSLLPEPVSEPIGTTLNFRPYFLSSIDPVKWEWKLIYNDPSLGEIIIDDKETVDSSDNDFSFYFSVPEQYIIRLIVTDSDGLQDQKSEYVTITESIAITKNKTSGITPVSVNFGISGLAATDSYRTNTEWDANGDGTYEADSLTTTYTFNNAATFSPKLRIKWKFIDKYISSKESIISLIKTSTFTAIAPYLSMVLTVNPNRGRLPLSCTFRADPNNLVSTYTWKVNGVTIGQTNRQVSYTFNQYGGYLVSVTAYDIYGNGPVTKTKAVQVSRMLSTSDDAVDPSNTYSIMEISGNAVVSPLPHGVGLRLPATTGTVTPSGFVADKGITLVTE